jgi:hypothetical protein
MGFDLYMVRDPDAVPDDMPEIVKESPSYFRGVPHKAMAAAGIFGDNETEPLTTNVYPPAGMTEARWEKIFSLFDRPTEDDPPTSVRKIKPTFKELRLMQNYMNECHQYTSARCIKPGKVPLKKFAANDGFHVTAEECLVIAYRLHKYLGKTKGQPKGSEDREFVEAFAAFNELAAKYDGYEVW